MQVKQKICSNTYLKFSSDLRSILGRLKSVICSHVVDVARPWLHNTILFSQPLSHCRHINSYFRSYILMKIHYILLLTLHHECFARGRSQGEGKETLKSGSESYTIIFCSYPYRTRKIYKNCYFQKIKNKLGHTEFSGPGRDENLSIS